MTSEASPAAQWGQLANDIGATALAILGAPFTVTAMRLADPKSLAVMLMSRSLSHFRGVFTLLDAGLVVEARVLVRCCWENAFWVEQLHADGDKFVRKMARDEARSMKVRGELALSKGTALTDDVRKRLQGELRVINQGWPDAEFLNPKGVALSGALTDGYLVYSQLSADAAHPTLTSLKRHVAHEDGEPIIDVEPSASAEEIAVTMDLACNALIGTCVGVNLILGGTPAGFRLHELADRYERLAKASSRRAKD